MSSTLLEQYAHALKEFGNRVEQVGDDQWALPHPVLVTGTCGRWSRTWSTRQLLGALPARVVAPVADAGDRFSRRPAGRRRARRRGGDGERRGGGGYSGRTAALDGPVSVSSGETSARDYIWEMTVDAAVHAWDLARGIGGDEQLRPRAGAAHPPRVREGRRGSWPRSGVYGRAGRGCRSGADLQTRMLGAVRPPRLTPSAGRGAGCVDQPPQPAAGRRRPHRPPRSAPAAPGQR